MANLSMEAIRTLAKKIVAENPGGIRYNALVQDISTKNPETPKNRIAASVWDLATRFPSEITKPSRGLFLPATSAGGGATVTAPVLPPIKVREEDFYEPFADWLKNELDEATVAIPLGGAGLQKKWGTPDVIGVYKALASHRIKFDLEIISAEIKIDPQQPVVAFGQAAAYRLFSAKSYIVMPNSISEEDYSRLEAPVVARSPDRATPSAPPVVARSPDRATPSDRRSPCFAPLHHAIGVSGTSTA